MWREVCGRRQGVEGGVWEETGCGGRCVGVDRVSWEVCGRRQGVEGGVWEETGCEGRCVGGDRV